MKGQFAAATVVLALTVSPPVHAQDALNFGLKAGVVGPGCVYVEDSDCFEADVNYSFGGFLDYLLGPRISGGVFVDAQGVSGDALDDTETMLEGGLSLKAIIVPSGSNVLIRPGIGVGYASVSVVDEDVAFLTLRGGAEVMFGSGPGPRFGGEVGVYAGPSGGNEDVDVTFGPGFLLRAIVEF